MKRQAKSTTIRVRRADVARVVEYIYADVQREYEKCRAGGCSCRKSIFLPVRRLAKAMEGKAK